MANWKMNPNQVDEAKALVESYLEGKHLGDDIELILAAPFVFLESLSELLLRVKKNNVALAAQDVFWESGGAFTGEISPLMLKSVGVRSVIVGHSERRRWQNETDEVISKKVKAALDHDLRVILCVGESKEVRDKGLGAAEAYVREQIQKTLLGVNSQESNIVIAYEPIWAISPGISDKPEDSARMANFIKQVLRLASGISRPQVLYGGSVTSANAQSFLEYVELDGALVGRASIEAQEFRKIMEIAAKICEVARDIGK